MPTKFFDTGRESIAPGLQDAINVWVESIGTRPLRSEVEAFTAGYAAAAKTRQGRGAMWRLGFEVSDVLRKSDDDKG